MRTLTLLCCVAACAPRDSAVGRASERVDSTQVTIDTPATVVDTVLHGENGLVAVIRPDLPILSYRASYQVRSGRLFLRLDSMVQAGYEPPEFGRTVDSLDADTLLAGETVTFDCSPVTFRGDADFVALLPTNIDHHGTPRSGWIFEPLQSRIRRVPADTMLCSEPG